MKNAKMAGDEKSTVLTIRKLERCRPSEKAIGTTDEAAPLISKIGLMKTPSGHYRPVELDA